MTPQPKIHAYTVVERVDGMLLHVRIGEVVPAVVKGAGLELRLDALPANGRIVLRGPPGAVSEALEEMACAGLPVVARAGGGAPLRPKLSARLAALFVRKVRELGAANILLAEQRQLLVEAIEREIQEHEQ